jgi:hypothetical protein
VKPFEGYKISSPYGPRSDPFTGQPAFHTGIDLIIADKAPILAFMAGEVVHAKEGVTGSGFGGFGNVVALRDINGAIQFYAHLSSISVKVGDIVKAGQEVGKQGNTGHSAGSHLHFEVRTNGNASGFGFKSDTEPTAYLQKYIGVTQTVAKSNPQIIKERIVQQGQGLKYIPLDKANKPYKQVGTDVRFIKFPKGSIRFEFVYEKGAKVSQLVKKYGADYGFNGPFFYNGIPLGDVEDHGIKLDGTGAYGKMLKWHEFGVLNGLPQVGQLDMKTAEWDLLVQGTPMLVENGKGCWDWYKKIEETAYDIANGHKQRTFVGINAAGDFMLAVSDGRTGSDQGLTLVEMGYYMLDKGAINALNFDGGSSSILADKTGGLNQSLNTGANEAIVNHAMLIFFK